MEQLQPVCGSDLYVALDLSVITRSADPVWYAELLKQIQFRSNSEYKPIMVSLDARHPGVAGLCELHNNFRGDLAGVCIRFDANVFLEPGHAGIAARLVASTHRAASCLPVPVNRGRRQAEPHGGRFIDAVVPHGLFATASGSAWTQFEFDAASAKRPECVRPRLAECLRQADNLADDPPWPHPSLNMDALLNRRVVMHVARLGELVRSRNMDPAAPSTLDWLRRRLRFIKKCFEHESMLLARSRGPFPQLAKAELIAELAPRYGEGNAARMVCNRFLRHQHVLALSPFAFFPDNFCGRGSSGWIKLLPLLAGADLVTMHGPDLRRQLTRDEWKIILSVIAAVIHQHGTIAHNPPR